MAITNEHINIDEILSEYFALKDEVQELKTENDFLERQNAELKKKYDDFYINDYLVRIEECNQLWGELFDIKHMSLWEFAEKYCNDDQLEQAGHDFAKELLGGV